MNPSHRPITLLTLLALATGACGTAQDSETSTVSETVAEEPAASETVATDTDSADTDAPESAPATTTATTDDQDADEDPESRDGEAEDDGDQEGEPKDDEPEDGEYDESTPDGTAVEEVDDPQPRLAIADAEEGVVRILDLATEEILTDVSTTGPARLTVTDDGRYVVASMYDDDEVVFLDAGAWGVDHGDHVHYYTAEPGQVGDSLEVDQPAHVVVTDASIALFSDGEGRALLLSEQALEEGNTDPGELEIGSVETGIPHHGVVADFDDVRIATIPFEGIDGDIPNEIGVEGDDGIDPLADCPEMHGEHVTSDGIVIACDDRIVVIDVEGGTAEATTVDYPETLSADRVWSWAGAHESDLVAAVEEDALLILDTETQEATALDLPADGVTMTAGSDDTAVLLTADGGVHLIDLEAGEIVASQPVGPTFDTDDDDAIRPAIAVGRDRAYITNPVAGTILEIATNDDLRVARTLAVDGVPGFIVHVGDETR